MLELHNKVTIDYIVSSCRRC